MGAEIGNSTNAAVASHASLLSLRGLTRRFGGLTAVDDIDLDLAKGELVSIIGPNGAGKTTLFNLVTGLDRPDGGDVRLDGQVITSFSPEKLAGHGIARTFQLGRVFGNLSVMENVLIGAHTRLRAVKPATPLIGPLAEPKLLERDAKYLTTITQLRQIEQVTVQQLLPDSRGRGEGEEPVRQLPPPAEAA